MYEGTELCGVCGKEFNFSFAPAKDEYITCPHCGTEQYPCSLCCECVSEDCRENIINSLKNYNEGEN